jgi:hypothetical protein
VFAGGATHLTALRTFLYLRKGPSRDASHRRRIITQAWDRGCFRACDPGSETSDGELEGGGVTVQLAGGLKQTCNGCCSTLTFVYFSSTFFAFILVLRVPLMKILDYFRPVNTWTAEQCVHS